MESEEVNLMSKYRVTDAANNCPQNSLEEPVVSNHANQKVTVREK
jgi:hypothetical protein